MGGLINVTITFTGSPDNYVGKSVEEFKQYIVDIMKNITQTESNIESRMVYIVLSSSQDAIENLNNPEHIISPGNSGALLVNSIQKMGYAHLQFTSYTSTGNNVHARLANWEISFIG